MEVQTILFCIFKQRHQEEGKPDNVIFAVFYYSFKFGLFNSKF